MQGDVDIEGVSFAYPARPHIQVLSNLNLGIKAGQTVALVGASGSGKSTVIQLLQRFYDPSAGRIRVDGTDIRQLSLQWYRDNVRSPVLSCSLESFIDLCGSRMHSCGTAATCVSTGPTRIPTYGWFY